MFITYEGCLFLTWYTGGSNISHFSQSIFGGFPLKSHSWGGGYTLHLDPTSSITATQLLLHCSSNSGGLQNNPRMQLLWWACAVIPMLLLLLWLLVPLALPSYVLLLLGGFLAWYLVARRPAASNRSAHVHFKCLLLHFLANKYKKVTTKDNIHFFKKPLKEQNYNQHRKSYTWEAETKFRNKS